MQNWQKSLPLWILYSVWERKSINIVSNSIVYRREWGKGESEIQLLFRAAAAAKSCQSYLTLCDPIDGSPTGFSVPGILQARIREWVAISFSIAWKWKEKVKLLSRVQLLATPWTAAYQAPPSMGFFGMWFLVNSDCTHRFYFNLKKKNFRKK